MNTRTNGALRGILAVAAFATVAALATACGAQVAASGPKAGGSEATAVVADAKQATERRIQLAEAAVRNGKYELPGIGSFQLTDGNYQEKYGEGATQVKRVGVVAVAFGDIDGDQVEDAAVALWANTGGSGTFIYLAPTLSKDGRGEQAGAQLLGDRVQIRSLGVDAGKIKVTLLTQGNGDALASPSLESIREYGLQGGKLVSLTPAVDSVAATPRPTQQPAKPTTSAAPRPTVQPTPQPVQAAPSNLLGTIWTWQRFTSSNQSGSFAVPYPAAYRLELLPDGTYSILADCNSGSGGYNTEGNRLSLAPGPMTSVACPRGSRSTEFIALLGQVGTYVLKGDALYLNLKADGGDMVFGKLYSVTGKLVGTAGATLPAGAMAEAMVVNSAGKQIGGSIVKAQLPMLFEAPYKPENIDPATTYTLVVTIKDAQQNVIFKSVRPYQVLTQGNPSYHLEVAVERAQ